MLPQPAGPLPPVALLGWGMGEDGRLLAGLPGLGYRGAVIEGMGAGHVPADAVPAVAALAQAMPVVLASRCWAGPAFTRTYGYPGSEIDLLARGLVPVCSASGTQWVDLEGGQNRRPASESACPHGWCTPRKPRADRGPGSTP